MRTYYPTDRRVIGGRTSLALQAPQARGVRVGRPRSLTTGAEQRVFELLALGLSVAWVAARLNVEAVPTAHVGKAWHATTVPRILERTAEAR